jgi:hypothetical protein
VGLSLRRVSAGVWPDNWWLVVLGVLLAGPVVCGMSQAANDWCDRHVDAINEPDRPIPSGRIPGRWGLWIALAMSALALALGWLLGPWGFGATVVAVLAAWAYSAEPVRLKRSGWWGRGWWACPMKPCPGSPAPRFWRRRAVLADRRHRAALRDRRPWHHDAERFQGAGGRSPDGRELASGHAWTGARRAGCLLGDGAAAGGVVGLLLVWGAAAP